MDRPKEEITRAEAVTMLGQTYMDILRMEDEIDAMEIRKKDLERKQDDLIDLIRKIDEEGTE